MATKITATTAAKTTAKKAVIKKTTAKTTNVRFVKATYDLKGLSRACSRITEITTRHEAVLSTAKVSVYAILRGALGIPDESKLVYNDADELEVRFEILRKSPSYKEADSKSQATVRQYFSLCRKSANYSKGKDGVITHRAVSAKRSPKHGAPVPENDAGKIQRAETARDWRDALAGVLKRWEKSIPPNVSEAIITAMIVSKK